MTHDYFKDYRDALDEMNADDELQDAVAEMILATAKMTDLEAPYKNRLRKAEEGIHAITLDQQRTILLHNIEAQYIKPRKSTSWKNVAMHFEPSNELIEEHSKVGSPSVKITVHDQIELEE